MPFRHEYSDVYDQLTRDKLQDIYEYVWLAVVDIHHKPHSRQQIAEFIIEAHEAGMSAEQIKDLAIDKFR